MFFFFSFFIVNTTSCLIILKLLVFSNIFNTLFFNVISFIFFKYTSLIVLCLVLASIVYFFLSKNFFFFLIFLYIYIPFTGEEVGYKISIKNNLLFNNFLLIHAPLLYLSYGMLFFFLFYTLSLSSCLNNLTYKKNSLIIFILLFLSIYLGSAWAQTELNWGGWWNWDLVEINSAVLLVFIILTLHNPAISLIKSLKLFLILLINFIIAVKFGIVKTQHSFIEVKLILLKLCFYFWAINLIIKTLPLINISFLINLIFFFFLLLNSNINKHYILIYFLFSSLFLPSFSFLPGSLVNFFFFKKKFFFLHNFFIMIIITLFLINIDFFYSIKQKNFYFLIFNSSYSLFIYYKIFFLKKVSIFLVYKSFFLDFFFNKLDFYLNLENFFFIYIVFFKAFYIFLINTMLLIKLVILSFFIFFYFI